MIRIDVNGNVTSRNRNYLLRVVRRVGTRNAGVDSAGRVILPLADGGHIIWFQKEEPGIDLDEDK